MQAKKWNYALNDYEPYELPHGIVLLALSHKQELPCASCSKIVTFGETVPSLEIHNATGFGFPVCSECENEEMKRHTAHHS